LGFFLSQAAPRIFGFFKMHPLKRHFLKEVTFLDKLSNAPVHQEFAARGWSCGFSLSFERWNRAVALQIQTPPIPHPRCGKRHRGVNTSDWRTHDRKGAGNDRISHFKTLSFIRTGYFRIRNFVDDLWNTHPFNPCEIIFIVEPC